MPALPSIAIGPLPGPAFKPFPRLPFDLRHKIWQCALDRPVDQPGVCVLSQCINSKGKVTPLMVRIPYSPLMATCREAREVATKSLPMAQNPRSSSRIASAFQPRRSQIDRTHTFTRKFNPQTDVLYVGVDVFDRFCDECIRHQWPRRLGIRHIALELARAEWGIAFPMAMRYLPELKTLSVVYPQATGQVDREAEVPLPSARHQVLRKFTEDEMDTFKIDADYLFEMHGGDWHIVWNKTAREHLKLVRDLIIRFVPDEKPKCWDEKTRTLNLNIEARCFEVCTLS
ncbi:hypothetical protein ACJZ2D_000913 [Fusarium nematophilum]